MSSLRRRGRARWRRLIPRRFRPVPKIDDPESDLVDLLPCLEVDRFRSHPPDDLRDHLVRQLMRLLDGVAGFRAGLRRGGRTRSSSAAGEKQEEDHHRRGNRSQASTSHEHLDPHAFCASKPESAASYQSGTGLGNRHFEYLDCLSCRRATGGRRLLPASRRGRRGDLCRGEGPDPRHRLGRRPVYGQLLQRVPIADETTSCFAVVEPSAAVGRVMARIREMLRTDLYGSSIGAHARSLRPRRAYVGPAPSCFHQESSKAIER